MWRTSIERGRLTREDLAADVDYRRTMMQMSRQATIRLLDLPWERPWYLVELSEDYDRSLLERFHSELVVPATSPDGADARARLARLREYATHSRLTVRSAQVALRRVRSGGGAGAAVEPVDVWVQAMADQPMQAAPAVLYHVVLALRDPDEDELDPVCRRCSMVRPSTLHSGC